MDMNCALHQLNIIYSSESSTGSSGNQCSWPRSRSSDKKFRWNELRVKWKSITVPRCFNNGSTALSSGVFQNLLFLNSKHHLNRGRRRRYLSQCNSDDSKMRINGDDNKTGSMESGNGEIGVDQLSKNVTSDQGLTNAGEEEMHNLVELRRSLQKQLKELEAARINSRSFEEKAQKISETAISLKDLSSKAWNNVSSTLDSIQDIVNQESVVNTSFQKASVAFYLAKARIKAAEVDRLGESSEISGVDPPENRTEGGEVVNPCSDKDGTHSNGYDIGELKANLEGFEVELSRLQEKKNKLQQDLDEHTSLAEKTQMEASKAEEDVANAMLLAEQAVAFELEVSQLVNDAEIALHNAEKSVSMSQMDVSELSLDEVPAKNEKDDDATDVSGYGYVQPLSVRISSEDVVDVSIGKSNLVEDSKDILSDSPQGAKIEEEKCKIVGRIKKLEKVKDLPKDGTSFTTPKSHTKKSSRFFPASFFSFSSDGTKFTPLSALHNLSVFAQRQFPKLIVGFLLLGAGITICMNQSKAVQFLKQSNIVSSMEEVSSITKPFFEEMQKLPNIIRKLVNNIPRQELNAEEASLHDILWLLLASVIVVPIFQRIPGGSPVLGYLAAGIFIGPYGLSIIRHVHGTKAVAEFGVVFLLFNIGLELSVERLSSMKKYVFGLGSAQVLATSLAIGLVASLFTGQTVPAAIVIGSGLALSSTAVVLQVLQERRESTARHGRAVFSVLLFQDLAVVVLLILIPLISPSSSGGGVGFQAIAGALGLAGVKAIAAIVAIIAGGRLLLRPIYKQIAENQNTEIFSANTLLVVLGTSLLTAKAGLSMALGAFLAGLLLAETEFALQVESDIAPYRGLLLGLFFMTVGMSIDPKLLISNFPVIMGMLGLLICGKAAIVAIVGKVFGISFVSALRVGLLLAPGGEFAFVAFGEAANQVIISPQLSSMLFLVVGLSMALTPWLAIGGQLIASRFELSDVRSLVPVESETDDLRGHIIICGFGRVGQIIAQLLSERLIPFVALDVRSDRVTIGRGLDLPVFFGDPGSREVLHKVGAERACAAAIAMDTPGANYRTVWALSKYFPNVKTFVRAHDIDHGINLEKAGATAVVPEILEPSLQLAAAVLAQAKLPMSEISTTINEFRSRHLSELTELSEVNGSSLGYGYSRVMEKSDGDVHPGLPESNDKESRKSEETPTQIIS